MRVSGVRPLLTVLDKNVNKFLAVLNDTKGLKLVRSDAREEHRVVVVVVVQPSSPCCCCLGVS